MGILGSAIGGALGIGGAIFGGISASKAMKKAKENVENEMKENRDWYNRRYNEDSTQRADAQRILTMTQDSIRERNRQASGAQAVMGGTEGVAAAKAVTTKRLRTPLRVLQWQVMHARTILRINISTPSTR